MQELRAIKALSSSDKGSDKGQEQSNEVIKSSAKRMKRMKLCLYDFGKKKWVYNISPQNERKERNNPKEREKKNK